MKKQEKPVKTRPKTEAKEAKSEPAKAQVKKSRVRKKLVMRRLRKFWKRKNASIYAAIFLAVLSLILFYAVVSSRWISEAEMDSALRTSTLSLDRVFSAELINFPYVLLQKLTFWLFGAGVFAIKLPSLVFGILSVWLMNSVAKRWFSPIIASFTTLIFVTMTGFLLAVSSGTPGILYVFYPLLIIFLINQIAIHPQKSHRYIIALFVVGSLAAYTPFMAYMLIFAAVALLMHPKTRFYLNTNEKQAYLFGAIPAAVICLPIVVSVFFDINLVKGLFLPVWSSEIWSNFSSTMLDQVFMFRAGVVGASLAPIFNLAIFGLFVLGIGQMIKNRYTFRSYLLMFWLVGSVAQVWANTSLVYALVVPIALIAAWGLHFLLTRWKTLFPINPYANATGFALCAIIAMAIVVTDLDFFTLSTRYSPDFNRSVTLALDTLEKADLPENTRMTIDAESDNGEFWKLVAMRQGLDVKEPDYQLFLTDGTPPEVSEWKTSQIIASTDQRTVFYLLALD
ncbi:glycosyltransferase family 39 protein [Candidatus Saccharibacteria bacterium]|nr:glycosyltransferase family 39 protein [Candidatus Saccharibacteria bacterium]